MFFRNFVIKNLRSQSSIEFIVLVTAVIFFFSLFFVAVNEKISERVKEKKIFEFEKLALFVQNEINLASKSPDGYFREFKIPEDLEGEKYEINLTKGSVYVRSLNKRYGIALEIPLVYGEIKKGNNLIKKENGSVFINP